MNKNILFYSAICVVLISLCVLFLLRIVPSAQVWEKYNVLYVDVQTDVSEIKSLFEYHNITGVLYPNHSPFPIPSKLAPVQYLQFTSGISYNELQTSFFLDENKDYNLYYVPQELLQNVLRALENVDFLWGIDSNVSIPAIPFFISIVLSAFLLFYSKNKAYYLSIQIPLILYCIVSPFYHIAATVCIGTFANFIIQKYWNRKDFIQALLKDIFVILACVLLLFGAILLGFKGFLLLFFTVLLSGSLVFLVNTIKQRMYNAATFKPILIHTSKTISTQNLYTIKFLVIVFCAICVLTILALMNIQPQKKNTKTLLHIPSPSGYTVSGDFSAKSYEEIIQEAVDKRLPDLTDFVSAAWYFEAYPYVKLSDSLVGPVLPGENIKKIDYVKNGYALEEKIEVIAQFDDAYIQRIISTALNGENAGAEKLLASQGGFSRINYAETGTLTTPTGAIIFLLLMCAYLAYKLVALKMKRR